MVDFNCLTKKCFSEEIMNNICYLCGSVENKSVFNENGIDIVKCQSCGHVFSTWEQEEHYGGYWDDAEKDYDLDWWDYAHRDIYRDFIQKFIKSTEGNLLDVGCGLGFFIKAVVENRPGWTAIGYEISEKAVKFANTKNGLKNVYAGIVQNSKIKPESMDIITLWDVIEHIPKPDSLLEYLYSILKPGGILFLQTPNFPIQLVKAKIKVSLKGMRPDGHYLEAKDHINNYTVKTMSLLAKKHGCSTVDFYVLKPILSVAGSSSKLAVWVKQTYYYITLLIFTITFKKVNLNNTLFAVLKK